MTQKKYIIAADLELTAPMHISAINKGTYTSPAGEAPFILRYEAKKSGFQCALTRTMQILTETGSENSTGSLLVPVIPASTFAGKLRRAAADLLFGSMVARNMQISPAAYNTLTTGTPSTDIANSSSIPEQVRAARNDPFINLFGGTPFMISSASVISEGWPLLDATTDLLMSPAILHTKKLTKLADMTDAVAIIRKNDALDMKGDHLTDIISLADMAAYVDQEAEARKSSKASKALGEESTKTSLRAINAFEAVRPGLAFALRIEVTSRSPAHLGLMLMAVQQMLRDGQVGGKAARGMGRFVVAENASRLYELDPESRQQQVLSAVFTGKSSGYEFAQDPVVTEAVAAAQDFVDACNPALYEAFASANAQAIKALGVKAAEEVATV